MRLKIINFVKEDIWLLDEQSLSPVNAIVIKAIKICILSAQGFSRDFCPLRASALTLYSLLSIVPVIAMLFGIAKGFGIETMLEQRLIEQAPNQDVLVLQLIRFAQNLLDSTKGGVVAGIGIAVLFWTIISVIGNIEASFNAIWKIDKGRSISRKFSDYLSLMLLAPILLTASSSITLLLTTKITWLITFIKLPEVGTWLVIQALGLLPLVLMIVLFTFTFIFMPNHKGHSRPGIIAGVVTGILYDLLQSAYLNLQIGVSSYNAIYGSFAALPLFVVWLQTGWMIVLFGCELSFFLQNYEIYRHNNRFADLSFSLKKVIALQVTHLIVKNFIQLSNPLAADEIAARLVIPIAFIQPVLSHLMASHIIIEVNNQNDEDDAVYHPAVDINRLTIAYVIAALEHTGQNRLQTRQDEFFNNVIADFSKLIETSDQNVLLKDL